MAKSPAAQEIDRIQQALRPSLRASGFKVRGRTFNRPSADGLTQVINIQMGPSNPPGTNFIPGLREDLHGFFTVNLGVYVPEVARHFGGGEARAWVQEYHCCVRSRLGNACGDTSDTWWVARAEEVVIQDVADRLKRSGMAFLERYGSRDNILHEWRHRSANMGASHPPRIVMALILAERGEIEPARMLLTDQVHGGGHPAHVKFVRELAERLGLGSLDG